MMKNIKVLYKGQQVELKTGKVNEYKYITEIKDINGVVKGFQIWNSGWQDVADQVAHIDIFNIDNSWISDDDIKVVVEKPQVTLEKQGAILNYTPHTVNIIDSEGNKIQDFPSQGEARCQQTTKDVGIIGNVPITSTTFGEVTGLPGEQEGTYYIVSRLIRQALPDRNDLLVPNDMVRDEAGRIIGCKSLANN